MNLNDITGQESGIVIRDNTIMVANWNHQEGLPFLAPWGNDDIIFLPYEIQLEKDLGEYKDIRDLIPGKIKVDIDAESKQAEVSFDGAEIVSDMNNDIICLYRAEIAAAITSITDGEESESFPLTSGKAYRLTDGTIIIAPDGWN